MRLCMFTPKDRALERGWPGRIDGDRVVQLAAQTLQAYFTGGGSAREHDEYALADVDLRAPVLHPPVLRDFDAGGALHFGNPTSIYGPDDEIPYPESVEELDFELELAAIIGAEGQVGGFTIMNDWTARDLERHELLDRLPPAKSTDFATSIGPVVVTPDELGDLAVATRVRVNGEERSAVVAEPVDWQERVALAARNTILLPGDVIGLGPIATGEGRALAPADIVQLEVEGIGLLRSRVGPRSRAGGG
jgi:fumarylacetoacetate (FAA) hydrolase